MGATLSEYEEREEMIRKLRELHGAFEMALTLAGDALAENRPELSPKEWFDTLLREGVRTLEDANRLSGRLAFFTDAEIDELDASLGASELAAEVARERVGRGSGIVPE